MKKILLPILMLLAMVGTSKAQTNALTVAAIELPSNYEATLTVSYQFDTEDYYAGYSFWVELPSELEFVMNGNNVAYRQGNCHNGHVIKTNLVEEQAVHILKVACTPDGGYTLSGTCGELLTFTIKPKSSVVSGQKYECKISNVKLSNETGSQSYPLSDCTFEVTIADAIDRIIFDENATSLPSYGDMKNVRMKRSISANKWSTIVLPFALSKTKAEAAFGNDVQLAEFTGFEVLYDEDDEDDVTPNDINIKFTTFTMTSKKPMTGGKPFLIKTSKDITVFDVDGVTPINTITSVTLRDEWEKPGTFKGTFVKSTIPEDGLFINDEKFWYSTGKTDVKAFRCWFELEEVLNKDTNFETEARVKFSVTDEDGMTTKIDARTMEPIETGKVYNMAGQYVGEGEDMNRLPKGIYIVNGKKVIK